MQEVANLSSSVGLFKSGAIPLDGLLSSPMSSSSSGVYTFELSSSGGFPFLSLYLYPDSVRLGVTLGSPRTARRGLFYISNLNGLVLFNLASPSGAGLKLRVSPDSPYFSELADKVQPYFDVRGVEVYSRLNLGSSPFGSLLPEFAPVSLFVDLGLSTYFVYVVVQVLNTLVPVAVLSSHHGLLDKHILLPVR